MNPISTTLNYYQNRLYTIMTRINVNIPVKKLTDEHLLAEHREIANLPYFLSVSLKSNKPLVIPEKFTLGTGHVKFFMNKMRFVLDRYKVLHRECLDRGFNVRYKGYKWDSVPDEYMGVYFPKPEDRRIIIDRIRDRLEKSPKSFFHYRGKRISKEQVIEFLES